MGAAGANPIQEPNLEGNQPVSPIRSEPKGFVPAIVAGGTGHVVEV